MKTYYKLELDYHPQEEWASAPMWLEMSFGAIGGGLFIFSAWHDYLPGLILGFLVLMAGKGLFLLADLGKPERFLGVLKRPFHSWISFGAWVFMTFGVIGLIYGIVALTGNSSIFLKVISILLAMILVVYDGFFLSASAGVAAWHSSSMLPALFGVSALAAGAALAIAFGVAVSPSTALILFAGLLFAHFSYVKGLATSIQSAKISADDLVNGRLKTSYLWVAVILGTVIPLAISVLAVASTVSNGLWIVAAACAVLGVFALRYSVLKAGNYAPVL